MWRHKEYGRGLLKTDRKLAKTPTVLTAALRYVGQLRL